jgi:heme/copper-type cytochrome/quinol oxidase subunit 4
MACALKNKTTGGAGLSEDVKGEKPVQPKKVKTKAEKQAEHIARIKRTLTGSLLGIATGALSFYLGGIPDAAGLQKDGFLGLMLMLAGIVIQKHIFIFMGMDTGKLGAKDWFYQGFITFAFWVMAWTILLTCFVGMTPSYTANVTSGSAPLAVQFNDTSVNTLTAWDWSFTNVTGNNTPVSWSTEQNTLKTFGAGNFSIALNASTDAGYTLARQVTFINVSAPATPVTG